MLLKYQISEVRLVELLDVKKLKKIRGMQRYEYALQLIELTKRNPKNEERFHELRIAEWKFREYMSDENNDISEENIMEFLDSQMENYLKEKYE